MTKNNKEKKLSTNNLKSKLKPKRKKRLKPHEFMERMERLKLIDQEINTETKLYDIKIKSLELEKQYIRNQIEPKSK